MMSLINVLKILYLMKGKLEKKIFNGVLELYSIFYLKTDDFKILWLIILELIII